MTSDLLQIQGGDQALLLAIERHSSGAWPAPEVVSLNGWECRFAPASKSRRVNSLTPLEPVKGRFAQTLSVARRLCRERQVACTVRVTPAFQEEDLASLADEGFVQKDTTLVKILPLGGVAEADPAVRLTAPPHSEWLTHYARLTQMGDAEHDVIDSMLSHVQGDMCLAALTVDGEVVSLGRSVVRNGLMGVFQIATAPSARRQGYAHRIVQSLLHWGRQQGAMRAYLQVVADNIAARSLYRSMGFKTLYGYTYFVKDETAD
jgi:ribosomal protein S18 acetylase RimI-like enzyme